MHEPHVLISGGAGGLGRAVCHNLTRQQIPVVVLEIDKDAAKSAVSEIQNAGGRATMVIGDITTSAGARAVFEEAVGKVGRINGLVNCAGVFPRRPILEITDEDWDFSFSVNVRGLYNLSVCAIEHMRAGGTGGRLVDVASIDALKTHPNNAHYAAMKAAVVSLTKSMGLAFAPDGILVNGVAPAAIATDKAKAAGWLPEIESKTPIGRAATPDDIAEVIGFLISEKNRYMVGETVAVSGGYFIP